MVHILNKFGFKECGIKYKDELQLLIYNGNTNG
jgi:hypothetical protein